MYSLAYPDMFSNSGTGLVKDHSATLSNLKLLLGANKLSLFGDPYFGTNLQHVIFSNNTAILKDLIIDDIYVSIQDYLPQLKLTRKDIDVYGDGNDLYATIKAINLIDYTTDLYEIKLTNSDEEA